MKGLKMEQIVIITHKTMAKGMAETIEFFAGKVKNLHYICSYLDNKNEFPTNELTSLIKTFKPTDQIFLLTDLLGGSINQHCSQLIKDHHINVITGINLTLALSIILNPAESLSDDQINKLVDEAKTQMIYMNDYDGSDDSEDE